MQPKLEDAQAYIRIGKLMERAIERLTKSIAKTAKRLERLGLSKQASVVVAAKLHEIDHINDSCFNGQQTERPALRRAS